MESLGQCLHPGDILALVADGKFSGFGFWFKPSPGPLSCPNQFRDDGAKLPAPSRSTAFPVPTRASDRNIPLDAHSAGGSRSATRSGAVVVGVLRPAAANTAALRRAQSLCLPCAPAGRGQSVGSRCGARTSYKVAARPLAPLPSEVGGGRHVYSGKSIILSVYLSTCPGR